MPWLLIVSDLLHYFYQYTLNRVLISWQVKCYKLVGQLLFHSKRMLLSPFVAGKSLNIKEAHFGNLESVKYRDGLLVRSEIGSGEKKKKLGKLSNRISNYLFLYCFWQKKKEENYLVLIFSSHTRSSIRFQITWDPFIKRDVNSVSCQQMAPEREWCCTSPVSERWASHLVWFRVVSFKYYALVYYDFFQITKLDQYETEIN